MEELVEQPTVRVVISLCPRGMSLISDCDDATMSKMVTSNSPKNLSPPTNLDRRSKRQEWIPKQYYNYGTMGHTRRFYTQLALTKVYRVKQPPTSSYPTYDQDNWVSNVRSVRQVVDSKGLMLNVVGTDNWKSSQKDDEMVPFGLANAPKAFQKMVLGFHKLNV